MRALALLVGLLPAAAAGQAVVATEVIPARSIIAPDQVALAETAAAGALTDTAQAVGLEARVTIYPGRPLRAADLAPPALVTRNGAVLLVFRAGGLSITAEGRALDRAAAGETVRAMNLASRTIVTGIVAPDGAVLVNP